MSATAKRPRRIAVNCALRDRDPAREELRGVYVLCVPDCRQIFVIRILCELLHT